MPWLESSLPFIAALQKLHFLAGPAKALSFLGNEQFFLLLLPLIYWCIDRKTGARLGILLLFSVAVNDIFKVAFQLPRPFWSGEVHAFAFEPSFGFPSGHAQNAVLLWTFLASRSKKPRLWVPLALVLVLFIALSRLYLGLHYPADLIGGAVIGFGLFVTATKLEPMAVARWRQSSVAAISTLSLFVSLALGTLYYFAFYHPLLHPVVSSQTERSFLATWAEAYGGKDITSHTGALFGLTIGLALAARSLKFEASVPLTKRAVRFSLGFIGILIFWRGLAVLLPDELPFRFIRYALTTFWVTYGAPRLFVAMERKINQVQDVSTGS